jgi:hypothetical protein
VSRIDGTGGLVTCIHCGIVKLFKMSPVAFVVCLGHCIFYAQSNDASTRRIIDSILANVEDRVQH